MVMKSNKIKYYYGILTQKIQIQVLNSVNR